MLLRVTILTLLVFQGIFLKLNRHGFNYVERLRFGRNDLSGDIIASFGFKTAKNSLLCRAASNLLDDGARHRCHQ